MAPREGERTDHPHQMGLWLNYGDVNAHLSRAGAASPDCAMAELIKAWVLVLSNDHAQITKAREMLADMSGRDLNEREASHLEALRLASTGRWPAGPRRCGRSRWPRPESSVAVTVVTA